MPKKRSRSRSKEHDREDRKTYKKLKLMQEQIDNLTKCMTQFIQSQKTAINTSGKKNIDVFYVKLLIMNVLCERHILGSSTRVSSVLYEHKLVIFFPLEIQAYFL